MLEVCKNVPMPKILRSKEYPFMKMEIGDMFFVPNEVRNIIANKASYAGKKLGHKFSTKAVHMMQVDENDRITWQPCNAQDEGAILGIGVWRIA